MMKYKGYLGEAFYDDKMRMFSGRVANARAIGTFYGSTVEELEREFHTTVDYYLDMCKRKGVSPEKPFSGRFNLRIPPELHSRIYQTAREENKSINAWIVEHLEGSL
ncbi:MAG: type II toxin-antitoxin system HicB family antitoxin [Deltaproteobacteria bacterium]|jgi:predicted HicB family RNase H-like nuclease|nr:type II toxin-antitoxin system HicB family antitoxin [Deltaproteobacteria bacterium]